MDFLGLIIAAALAVCPSGMRAKPPGINAQAAGINAQTSGINAQAAGIIVPTCGINAQTSGIIVPTSRINAQTSGIEGKVFLLSGNRMPSPPRRPGDTIRFSREGPGVKGTVCVFELTNDSQVARKGTSPYCMAVHTRLIRQVETDDKGNFHIPLPPGTYSVFTKKGNLFYATRRDAHNNIAPVKVLPGKITRVDCSVESDQKVVY
ncbi:MAG TPA: carboxypeptidase-like regulatory domain-containing protein [Puia sp.]|nr:carboxypeptidase-like regulatory domain-containing protein [Puia sp.]